ncbi:hypothetical protein CHISP_0861 [Chitinispirillum alkaliphilum]|nr:hypothetical protein CHISP_0861 [Chitinispirillum alkaliphilum]
MVLAEDINLSEGRLLLSESHRLDAESIKLLKKYEIEKISIKPEESRSQSQKNLCDPHDFIKIFISGDSMHASLTIEAGLNKELLSLELLKDSLTLAGVVEGIKESALVSAVEKWPTHNGMYKIETVAQGTPPLPHHEGPFTMKVKYLNSKKMVEDAKGVHYYWEFAKICDTTERIDPETVIAERSSGTPSIPGKTVGGELLFNDEIVERKINLDGGVRLSDDGTQIIATITGVAFCIDDTIGAIPIDYNGSVELEVKPDNMAASLMVHPPGSKGSAPGTGEIYTLLQNQGITHGIIKEEIEKTVKNMSSGISPSQPVVIAKGTEPVNGENGKIKYLVSIETSLKPKVNENGVADYKNVDIIVPVAKGRKLAQLISPQKGTPGVDVRGNEKAASDGKAAQLPIGQNTEQSREEPDFLIATIDGIVKYDGSNINIFEGYVVEGDVDFSTGNIKYEKSVTINGDVHSGFKIECGGDLQVGGTIEDCNLEIGGNVLCKYGFIGQGKGVLEAKGDVNLGFIKNQTVKSRGNVNIAKEALNSIIFSRKSVEIHGGSLSVAGGSITARHSIVLNVVGNSSGIRTHLEVGIDYALGEEMRRIDLQLEELHLNLKKVLETNNRFEKNLKFRKQLTTQNQQMYKKVKETILTYQNQIKILEDRKNIASSKLHNIDNCYIRIKKAALPGTIFKISDRHHLVKEKITGPKTIRVLNNEIKII